MKMLARLRLIVVALTLLVLAPVPAAWAHAQLLTTEPVENAVLETVPSEVTLIFNEPVSPLAVKLIGPDGAAVEVSANSGARVTVALPAELSRGTHVLSYRVVSTDGHPIGGSLVFSVGEVTGAATSAQTDIAVSVALWASKAALFVAMFVGIGGGVFLIVGTLPPLARQTATALTLLGIIAAGATLGLQGLDALGLPLDRFFDGAVWSAAFATSYGYTAIATGLAFAIAFLALRLPSGRTPIVFGAVAGILAALSLALSGHASAAAPRWVTRPAVFLHISGVLFWVGALVPLWLLLRDQTSQADQALSRFSRIIPFAVAPLVASGLALAVIQLGLPGPQWLTAYGFILASKLGLLVVLFGLALWNRRYLTAPALAGETASRVHLRRSIGIELAIVVAILALVAGWRFTPPPRALAAAPAITAAASLVVHAMDASSMAILTITPGRVGPVTIEASITDMEGTPKDAQAVSLTLSSPELGIEPIKRDAVVIKEGWRVSDLTIPVAGTWQIEIEVRVSRFELAKLQTEITVP